MNANELAEELHDLDVQASQQSLNDWAEQAATMLRQQQAEIANLKAGLLSHHDIYPVKEQLTDEEIIHIWNTCETDDEVEELVMKDFILFARAILRKAQEK